MTEIRNIKVTIEEKNLIINNGADKLPLNPTSQGFSGQSVRKQLSQAVTGAKGSVLALMIEKFSIIEDFSNTVLLVEVKVVGDDLTFVYADGREFKFELDVITNGLVKFVNDKAPDENGHVVINIDDISELRNFITSTLQEAKDYTYSQVEIDNKDAAIMNKANNLENDKVDKKTTIIGLDLRDNILIGEFRTALGNATQSVAGLLSAEDKTHLDGLVALLETSDGNNVVDTIGEILEIFQNYPEGADLVTVLQGKVDKVIGKGLSTNDFTDLLKDKLDSLLDGTQYYDKTYIDALKDKNGWESELLGTLSNNGTIDLSVINEYDEIQMYAKDTLGVIDNENIRPSLIQSGDSVYFFDDTQSFIMVDTVFGFYAPVGYTLQVVGLKYTDFTTDKVETRQVGETIITYESGVIVSMASDNVVESIEYDVNGEVDKVTSTYADGKIYEETYTKDVYGNITKIMKVEVI